MKIRRSEEYEVLEEVFDKPTLMTIYRMMNHGYIEQLNGVVKSGKESRVYHALSRDRNELAVKIYLTVSAEFKKGMIRYIQGDERFASVRRDSKHLIYLWAQKEFRNLSTMMANGIRAPKPIHVENNVLIMEFIGENGEPAPLLREAELEAPGQFYDLLLKTVEALCTKVKLVHGDLSEFNIMIWNNEPVIIDVSQSVPLTHPLAKELLKRDIDNLNRYFQKLDVKVRKTEDIAKKLIEDAFPVVELTSTLSFEE